MTPQTAGTLFVCLWIAAAVLYDCAAYFLWQQPEATISRVLRGWAGSLPVLGLALGCLLYHLFGPPRGRELADWRFWVPLGLILAGFVVYWLFGPRGWPDMGPPTRLE